MSKFSEFLKYQLKQTGQSVSAVAKGSGVERTSIHKVLNDERTLSYKSAKKLAEYLCLSPQESKTFFEYHGMHLQGNANYEIRRQIVRLLKDLSQLPHTDSDQKIPVNKNAHFPVLEDHHLYSGTFSVRCLLRQITDQELTMENPVLKINLPASDSFFLNYIYTIFQQYKTRLQITHIIPYENGMCASDSYGITILEHILPLSLTAQTQYTPYFFYDKSDNFTTPFPYFILTSSYVLCIARDYEAAVCISNEELRSFYHRYFSITLKNCRPLLHLQSDAFEILTAYSANTTANSYYTFMAQPCIGKFYTPELIEAKVRKELPHREELIRQSELRFSVLREISGTYYTFFTRKGLRDFMENGIICDIPQQLILPFTVEERRIALAKLRNAIADDSVVGRLTNEYLLSLPPSLSFCISANNQIDIFTLPRDRNDDTYYNIHIDELMIGRNFLDFVLYLPQSEYLLSKEETLAFLDQLLS